VTDDKAIFADVGEKAFFQVKVYPADKFTDGEEIFMPIGNQLQADGEGEIFQYQGMEAVFTDLLFPLGESYYQGFGVYINGDNYDWVILAFAEADYFQGYQFPILSALDSFSINWDALVSPGPVSRFYESSFNDPKEFEFDVPFGDKTLNVLTSEAAMETTQVTVEREAKVLGIYSPEDTDAWQRFYRMIYRDNFRRIDWLYRSLIMNEFSHRQDPREISEDLLSWIQGFEYHRTGTPTDFSTPLETLYNHAGDCDSLGLLYVLLLKHFGVDAIMMVSSEYSHAMAAADVEGVGARFPFEEENWVVAECTTKVDLGRIMADVADPDKWLGISFYP